MHHHRYTSSPPRQRERILRIGVLAALLLWAGLAVGQRFRPPPPPPLPRFKPPTPVTKRTPVVGARSGALRMPLGRPRSPVVADLHRLSHMNPPEAVQRLARFSRAAGERSKLLSPVEHAVLLRQALNKLSILENPRGSPLAGADVWSALRKTRKETSWTPDENEQVEAMSLRLERQIVRDGIAQISRLAERKQLGLASALAEDWLAHDRKGLGDDLKGGKEFKASKEHAALRDILVKIRGDSAEEERWARLEAQWRSAEPATWPAFAKTAKDILPEAERRAVAGLMALEELRPAVRDAWRPAHDAKQLKALFGPLRDALADLPAPGDPTLAGRLQQDLSIKAFLAGDVAAARELWPADGPADHAGKLMSDLRAHLTGKGKVTTEPGRETAGTGMGGDKPPKKPPVGLGPLMPEGPEDWKPPPAAPRDGPTPLEEATAAAELLRRGISEHFTQRRLDHATRLGPHLAALEGLRSQLQKQDAGDTAWLDEAARKAGLTLQPLERAWLLLPASLADREEAVKKLKERRRQSEIDEQIELLKSYLELAGEVGQLGVETGDDKEGARIRNVFPESAAAKAGLRLDDIILSVNGEVCRTTDDLISELARFKGGETVTLKVRRGDEELKIQPILLTFPVGGALPGTWPPRLAADEYEERLLKWARRRLLKGEDLADLAASLIHHLREDVRAAPGGLRVGVHLDLIALELHSDLDALEESIGREMLEKRASRADVVARLRELRRSEQRKHDLERVQAYVGRPLTAEEQKNVRALLEDGKDVGEALATLPGALGPAWPAEPERVVEIVRLDEIAEAFEPELDAFEMDRARHLLREGRRPGDIAALLELRRSEALEAVVQRGLKVFQDSHSFRQAELDMAEELLRQGRTTVEVWQILRP